MISNRACECAADVSEQLTREQLFGEIASQAVISETFSLTRQAVLLGYLPRLRIDHTSPHEIGQIYIPQVNGALMVATMALVIGFGSSSRLAAAYGIAVSLTMLITTILMHLAAVDRWKWPPASAAALTLTFLVIDLGFVGSNLVKIGDGGWFPLLVALLFFTLMTT